MEFLFLSFIIISENLTLYNRSYSDMANVSIIPAMQIQERSAKFLDLY